MFRLHVEQEGSAVSFCCGASMIGTRGTLRHMRTRIQNVPLLFCPVCHRVEIHHLIEHEYELLAEYAHGDGALDVNFDDFVDVKHIADLYDNCVNVEDEDPVSVLRNQIDMALDLLSFAKSISDAEWEEQLKTRLQVLSRRYNRLQTQDKNQLGRLK